MRSAVAISGGESVVGFQNRLDNKTTLTLEVNLSKAQVRCCKMPESKSVMFLGDFFSVSISYRGT